MKEIVLGIDLGTSNTVCYRMGDTLEILKFRGKELLKSALLYREGKIIVGNSAKKKITAYPQNVILSSKTFMGDDKKIWEIQDQKFNPTDVAKYILMEVIKEANKKWKGDKYKAVITTPEYFDSKQREETKKAAEAAGIEVLSILSEPVAAALAYSMNEAENKDIFIIDLGGGTFDVSILKIEDNKFITKGTGGDRKLGGDNFDNLLLEKCLETLRIDKGINLASLEKSGLDEENYYRTIYKLLENCEKAKIELSSSEETDINVPSLISNEGKAINFSMHITRDEFNTLSKELLERIELIIKKCLSDARYTENRIDKVIMVGGSTNIPAVKELVKDIFDTELYSDKDLSKLVAEGAVIKAAIDAGYTKGFVKKAPVIQDVLSHSFGVEIGDGKYSIIIRKGTKYPCKESNIFTTMKDNQEIARIKVYEGEDESDISNNTHCFTYEHKNIEQSERGEPDIEIIFSIDENRILSVNSMDLKTRSKAKGESINI